MTKDQAVDALAHQVAGYIHLAMAATKVNVAELRSALDERDRFLVDDLLAAKHSDQITVRFLADVAFVLGFTWDFKLIENKENLDPEETLG